ncbi:MAG: hypothetical protein ACLRSW_16965 [Christensenellaceae bacterium]
MGLKLEACRKIHPSTPPASYYNKVLSDNALAHNGDDIVTQFDMKEWRPSAYENGSSPSPL